MANSLLNKFKNAFKKNKPFEPIMGEYEKPPRSTSIRHGHQPAPEANNTVRQNVPPVPPIPNTPQPENLPIPPRTSSIMQNHLPVPPRNSSRTQTRRGLYVTNPDPVNTNESMSLSTNTRDSSIRTYNDISNSSSASQESNMPKQTSNESLQIEAPRRARGQ